MIVPNRSSEKVRHGFDSYITVHAKATEKIVPNHEEYRLSIHIEDAKLETCLQKYERVKQGILDMFK